MHYVIFKAFHVEGQNSTPRFAPLPETKRLPQIEPITVAFTVRRLANAPWRPLRLYLWKNIFLHTLYECEPKAITYNQGKNLSICLSLYNQNILTNNLQHHNKKKFTLPIYTYILFLFKIFNKQMIIHRTCWNKCRHINILNSISQDVTLLYYFEMNFWRFSLSIYIHYSVFIWKS